MTAANPMRARAPDGCRSGDAHRRRLAAALAITGALLLAAPAAQVAGCDGSGAVRDAGARAGLDVTPAGSPKRVLDEVERQAAASLSPVPDTVAREVILPGNARDTRSSSDGTVVGYLVDEDPGAALASLEDALDATGWTPVSLGGIDGMTFLKSEGEFTWMLVTATQVGNATSVVMRLSGR